MFWNRNRSRWAAAVLCGLCLLAAIGTAYANLPVIFVAGNPDLYPIEYYDAREKTYKGVIPALLQEFSARSGYRIVYLDDGGEDGRRQGYEQKQAELISGCSPEDGFPEAVWQAGAAALRWEQDGAEREYRILFSDIAEAPLREALVNYFSGLPASRQAGLLLAETAHTDTGGGWWILLCALAVFSCLLLVIIVRRYRKKIRLLYQQTELDRATGLGNYDHLVRYYQQRIHDKNRALYMLVYIQTDIGRIRQIGGSEEADEFLRYVGVLLNEYLADTDLLARVADGSFAVLRLSAGGEAEQWILPVLRRIEEYAQQYGKTFLTEAWAGIYHLEPHDRDLEGVVRRAEQSCRFARLNGRDFAECSREILSAYQEEISLQTHISQALKNKEFLLYLHFFVDVRTRKIVGAEALSRWNHPEKGLLLPGRYIPLMEREKTVSALDYDMLEQVCRFLQALYAQKQGDFFISCNFSRSTFAAPDFTVRCQEILDRYRFPREALILELTESGVVRDVDVVYQNAMKMKDCGVSIALDDFGEGYTSFSDLQTYRFDGLKIDRSLIENVHTEQGEIILRGIVDLGHRLGLTVLAEGAETEAQVEKLTALRCDVIQGFYFYKPLPLAEAKKVYEAQLERPGIS